MRHLISAEHRLPQWRPVLWSLALLLISAATMPGHLLAQTGLGNDAQSGQVNFRDGKLSVSVDRVSRIDLLQRVGDEMGFVVIAVGELKADVRSWSFVDLPLEKALKRLLTDTNAIVTRASPANAAQPISAVYLLGSGTGVSSPIELDPVETGANELQSSEATGSETEPGPSPASLPEHEVDHEAVAELLNTLHFDAEPESRLRALGELQAIGGDTLRAALESALGDSDEEVRLQVEFLLENLPTQDP